MPKVQSHQTRSENDASVTEPKPGAAPSVALPEDKLAAGVEAVLLAVDKPLSAPKIAQAIGLNDAGGVKALIAGLNETYETTGRSFRIEQVAGGYRVLTLPDFAPAVAAIRGLRESAKLSRAAIETLAIVAYKQPITRVQIEAVRGVACGEVVRTLLDRRLLAIVGRAEELGRPMLYGTSKLFLETFGLASIADLPKVTDLFPGVDPSVPEKAGKVPARGTPPDDAGETDREPAA